MLRDPRNLSIVRKIEGGQSSEIGKPVLIKNPATVYDSGTLLWYMQYS